MMCNRSRCWEMRASGEAGVRTIECPEDVAAAEPFSLDRGDVGGRRACGARDGDDRVLDAFASCAARDQRRAGMAHRPAASAGGEGRAALAADLADRAGCAFTSNAVTTNTVIPNTSSAPTDHRRLRTSGSDGAGCVGSPVAVSVATAALNVAGRRRRRMRRLHAASATRPMKIAIFKSKSRPNVVSTNDSRDQPTSRHVANTPVATMITTLHSATGEN